MSKARKRSKIVRESVKDLHTSHWDLDMLSREELEQLMAPERRPKSRPDTAADSTDGSDAAG